MRCTLVAKALNRNSLTFAHPLTFNNGKPVGSSPTLTVEYASYQNICISFKDMYNTVSHLVVYDVWLLLLKVDGWANIKEFPFRA